MATETGIIFLIMDIRKKLLCWSQIEQQLHYELVRRSFRYAKIRDLCLFQKENTTATWSNNTCFYSLAKWQQYITFHSVIKHFDQEAENSITREEIKAIFWS